MAALIDPGRTGRRLVAGALLAFGLVAGALAQTAGETAVKAAFLFNFAQFVSWPQEGDELRICAHAGDDLGSALDTLAGRKLRRMVIAVGRTTSLGELKRCHLVYLSAKNGELLPRVLDATRGHPVLIVATTDGAAQLGAGLGLFDTHDGRLGFDANFGAMREAGLAPSSRLLQLARRVF